MTSVLPSDFAIEPVSRSPFFSTIWSASAGIVSNKRRPTTGFVSTRTSLVIRNEMDSGAGREADYRTPHSLLITTCFDWMQELYRTARIQARAGDSDVTAASGLILGLGLRLGFSLGIVVLHAIFQRADALAQTLSQLRQFLGAKHQQGNKEDHQQVHGLKQTFKHKASYPTAARKAGTAY